jgi:uncharacterized protein YbjT (DUF2867 family)
MNLTALVAGGTGLVGNDVLRLLVEDRLYDKVIALVRRPLGFTSPRLQERIVDFGQLRTLDLRADHVYCALGTTIKAAGAREAFRRVDYQYVNELAARTRECGARRFALISSVGANPRARNFYLRTKGEAEQAVRAAGFDATHIFRPSFLVGPRKESRTGEKLAIPIARAIDWALVNGLRKYRSIRAIDVACAMIAANTGPHDGVRIYHFDEIWTLSRGERR